MTIVQNFDGVTAPTLPAGWTTTSSGVAAVNWVTSATNSDTAPNNAFVPNPANISDNVLNSASFVAEPTAKFRNSYDIENGFDGGVLEIAIAGGAFTDILAAGGAFVTGGYTGVVDSNFGNPLSGRNAWTGNSSGYIDTIVNLPASAVGQSVQLRWRLGTDNVIGTAGWRIDTVETYAPEPDPEPTPGTWVAQGPGPANNGQVENITNKLVVGAVNTVLPHPTNPDIVYIGGSNGGIWKTTNATSANPNWVPLTDEFESLSIGDLQFDPTDATRQTVVAGVGLYSSFGRIGGARIGVLRTTDGGENWTVIDGGGTLRGKNISGVAARGNNIVVSVNIADVFSYPNIGIFRSTNGGTSFTQISSGSGTGLPGGSSYSLASDPSDPNVLYTNTVFAGSANGVYKSTNFGANWARVSNATMNALMTDQTTNVDFGIGTSNNVYVGIVVNGNPVGFFRSGDGSGTWAQMDSPSTNENGTNVGLNPNGVKGPGAGSAPEELAGGQGAIHFSIVADPTNPNIVYVGGDRQPRTFGDTGGFPNSIGATDFSGRLFRGNAAQPPGSQWAHITHSSALGAAGGGTANNSSPHADSRDMAMDANGNIIEGDDGGIYRRTNPTSDTGDWFSMIGDLQTTEIHDVAYDPISNIVISGNQDTGTTEQVTPNSKLWRSVSTADGGDVSVDFVTLAGSGQSIRYSSFQNLGSFRRRVVDANNNVISTVFPARTVTSGAPLTPAFKTPVELNNVNAQRLLIVGANGIYESSNRGDTIAAIGAAFGSTNIEQDAVAYGGYKAGVPNPDVLYVGFGDDLAIRTSAGGALTARDPDATTTDFIRDVVMHSDDWESAFAISSNKVYYTTNAGLSWSNITGNLMTLAGSVIQSIEFIGGSINAIAVGGTLGVFTAFVDDLGTWSELGAELPHTRVFDMRYNLQDDVLVAGTFGRGAWMISDVQTLLGVANTAPTLTTVAPLSSANEDTAFSISYATLATAANEADPEGDVLSFRVEAVLSGTLTKGGVAVTPGTTLLSAGETWVWTPPTNATGDIIGFTVTAFDGELASAPPVDVTINVVAQNDAPVANPGSLTTAEDTTADGQLSASDVDGDTLEYIIVADPSHGTVVVDDETGEYTYTPVGNYNGSDSFTFKVNDGTVDSNVATISITVTAVNDAPATDPDSLTTAEDTAADGQLSASDIDGDTLEYIIVSGPSHGTVVVDDETGEYTYTPAGNYNGSDSFTFKVNDGAVDSNIATISITVTAVNDAPVANPGSLTTAEDTAADGQLSANDVEGDTLEYIIAAGPSHGTVVVDDETGEFTYTPAVNHNGSDSFTFKVNDGAVDSNIATISITVTAVNDAPVANPGSLTTAEDTAADGQLSATDVDGDPLEYILVAGPSHGTVVVDDETGEYTYTPAANYFGSDSFTFKVNDGAVDSNIATISVTVTAVNDAPVANPGSLTTAEDTAVAGQLSATDVEGDTLEYIIVAGPSHGTVVVDDATGEYTYTLAANYNGSDSFTFKVNDGAVDSNIATISITVTAVNDAPVANDGTLTTTENSAANGTLSATDVEGDTLNYTIVGAPSHGTVKFNAATGAFTYTPFAAYQGDDSFTARASDGALDSNVSTISITIAGFNDAPVLSAYQPSLGTISHGATSAAKQVADLLKGHVTDVDPDLRRGIAITFAKVLGGGHWEYQYDKLPWTRFTAGGAPSQASALLVPGRAYIRYVSDSATGTVYINFRAWDQSQGMAGGRADLSNSLDSTGGLTAFSRDFDQATLAIINVKPVLTQGDLSPVGYLRDSAPGVHFMLAASLQSMEDKRATLVDPDSPSFDGGVLSVHTSAGARTGDRLTLGWNFSIAGTAVKFQSTQIGTAASDGKDRNDLTIIFNSQASRDLVARLINALRFKTENGTAGPRTLQVRVSDGDGGLSNTLTRQVFVN